MRLYIFAMLDEAKDIINDYQLISSKPYLLYKKDNKLLAITSVGKVNSAFVLTNILSKYNVSEIINIGFVGASKDFVVGDEILVEQVQYHDFDISMFGYKVGELPNVETPFITNLLHFNGLRKHFNSAVLYSGDQFLTTPLKGRYIVDMEGASLYHVALFFNTPIISLKVVSDIVGNQLSEYQEFEKVGSKNILSLYNKVEALLND